MKMFVLIISIWLRISIVAPTFYKTWGNVSGDITDMKIIEASNDRESLFQMITYPEVCNRY